MDREFSKFKEQAHYSLRPNTERECIAVEKRWKTEGTDETNPSVADTIIKGEIVLETKGATDVNPINPVNPTNPVTTSDSKGDIVAKSRDAVLKSKGREVNYLNRK